MNKTFHVVLIFLLLSVAIHTKEIEVKDYRYKVTLSGYSPEQVKNEAEKLALEEIAMQYGGVNVAGFSAQSEYEDNYYRYENYSNYISTFSTALVKSYKVNYLRLSFTDSMTAITVDLNISAVLNIPDDPNPFGLIASLNKSEFKDNEIAYVTCSLNKEAHISILTISDKDIVNELWSSADKLATNQDMVIPPEKDPLEIRMMQENEGIEYGTFLIVASSKPIFSHINPPKSYSLKELGKRIKLDGNSIVFLPYMIK